MPTGKACKTKAKVRLDLLLVENGLAESRQRAQAYIMGGYVSVRGVTVQKSGYLTEPDAVISVKLPQRSFVSRGGDKLAHALQHFQFDMCQQIVLDVGASTGGFTDCALQHGAARVYAVDVGRNQLDFRLRKDPRVVVIEKQHARDIEQLYFEQSPSVLLMDVSFISIRKILRPCLAVLGSSAKLFLLVKPQFELEPQYVAKGGVVRDGALQQKAVDLVSSFACDNGCSVLGLIPSAVKGLKKGNQEWFLHLAFPNPELAESKINGSM